jgi:hypothetical protein
MQTAEIILATAELTATAEASGTLSFTEIIICKQCPGSTCFWASRILLSSSKKIRKTLIPTVL